VWLRRDQHGAGALNAAGVGENLHLHRDFVERQSLRLRHNGACSAQRTEQARAESTEFTAATLCEVCGAPARGTEDAKEMRFAPDRKTPVSVLTVSRRLYGAPSVARWPRAIYNPLFRFLVTPLVKNMLCRGFFACNGCNVK